MPLDIDDPALQAARAAYTEQCGQAPDDEALGRAIAAHAAVRNPSDGVASFVDEIAALRQEMQRLEKAGWHNFDQLQHIAEFCVGQPGFDAERHGVDEPLGPALNIVDYIQFLLDQMGSRKSPVSRHLRLVVSNDEALDHVALHTALAAYRSKTRSPIKDGTSAQIEMDVVIAVVEAYLSAKSRTKPSGQTAIENFRSSLAVAKHAVSQARGQRPDAAIGHPISIDTTITNFLAEVDEIERSIPAASNVLVTSFGVETGGRPGDGTIDRGDADRPLTFRDRVRHRGKGSAYTFLGWGPLKTGIPVGDGTEIAIYCDGSGHFAGRPRTEFEDGRFERLSSSTEGPGLVQSIVTSIKDFAEEGERAHDVDSAQRFSRISKLADHALRRLRHVFILDDAVPPIE